MFIAGHLIEDQCGPRSDLSKHRHWQLQRAYKKKVSNSFDHRLEGRDSSKVRGYSVQNTCVKMSFRSVGILYYSAMQAVGETSHILHTFHSLFLSQLKGIDFRQHASIIVPQYQPPPPGKARWHHHLPVHLHHPLGFRQWFSCRNWLYIQKEHIREQFKPQRSCQIRIQNVCILSDLKVEYNNRPSVDSQRMWTLP